MVLDCMDLMMSLKISKKAAKSYFSYSMKASENLRGLFPSPQRVYLIRDHSKFVNLREPLFTPAVESRSSFDRIDANELFMK